MHELIISENEAGSRIDSIIAAHFPSHSRQFWQEQIREGVIIRNTAVPKPSDKVKIGDRILVPEISQPTIDSIITHDHDQPIEPIEIIYEDESVLVINKPFGLITHPAHAHTEDSVVHRILFHDKSVADAVYDPNNPISLMRPGIVHRLDKDTSGVLIIAKTKQALSFLAKQIQDRKVTKIYQALLFGHLDQSPLTVENWMNRSSHDRRKMTVVEDGKGREAKTIFTIKQLLHRKAQKATLVEAQLITGRTHQIRVHASHIGHPVLGDNVYGFKESEDFSHNLGLHRQFLHAYSLSIRLPGQPNRTTFTAPLPDDLTKVLAQLT